MKTVKIDRKRWTRSDRAGNSALRTESGQSCCLGFVARACGLRTPVSCGSLDALANLLPENRVEEQIAKLPKLLRPVKNSYGSYDDTALTKELVSVNDAVDFESAAREKKIRTLLAKAGIKAVFVG